MAGILSVSSNTLLFVRDDDKGFTIISIQANAKRGANPKRKPCGGMHVDGRALRPVS